MRTLYIHLPGKSVESQVPEKHKVLMLEKSELKRITDHLTWLGQEEESAEKFRDKKAYMKSESKKLSKNGTHDNQQERKLAARLQRVEEEHKTRDAKHQKICEEKAEERRKFIDGCRKIISFENDNTRSLNSALRFSEVVREREAQIEFDKKLQQIEEEREAKHVARIMEDVKHAGEEKMEKRRKNREKNINNRALLQKQLDEKMVEMQKEQHEKVLEREDLDKLSEEIKRCDRVEKEMVEAKKKHAMKMFLESVEEDRQIKELRKREAEEEDKILAIFAAAKQRMAGVRKEKEKAMRAEEIKVRDKIAAKIAVVMQSKDAEEEAALKKAVAELEAKEDEMKIKKEKYQKRLIKEMLQDRQNFLEKEEKRKKEEFQMKKWAVLQRYKQEEVNNQIENESKIRKQEVMVKTRKGYDVQMEERYALIKKEKEYAVAESEKEKGVWDSKDEEFLQYAKEVIDESREKGRLLLPMERVVENYKKKYGLVSIRKTKPSMRSQIPFGPNHDDDPDPRFCPPCTSK